MRRSVIEMAALAVLFPAAASASGGSPQEQASSLTAAIAAYVLPDASDYLQPTATVDHGWLHLEARYNYEDRKTGSLFVGRNYEIGENPSLEITPMLGGVAGRTAGVAPGLAVELAWGPFDLRSESEYVFDLGDLAASFFYSWSELGARLGDHLRAGLAAQRTKVFHTSRVVALGPWLGASLWKIDAAVYVFDPFDQGRFLVASLALKF